MRVLHIAAGNLYGGVETLLVTLARMRGLCPEMEPHFAVCFEGRLSAELAATDVPVHNLGAVRISRPWTVWRARSALRALLRRERFDRIICHSSWPLAVFGPAARRENVPLAHWVHNYLGKWSWLDRWALRNEPAITIFNSRYVRGETVRLFPWLQGTWLYCPVELDDVPFDTQTVKAVRDELMTPLDATVIIQVSRMEAWKGHELHLRALAEMPSEANWRCWMVGGAQRQTEREYLDALKQLAAKLGVAERVQFLGERKDVPRLLRAADIHCQPNMGPEPFGITFIEALWAGLPVVTTAMGGALEIVDDTCGRLVPPGDVGALAMALSELAADARLRRRLGEHGPGRAKAICDPRTQLQKLLQTLVGQTVSTLPGHLASVSR